MNKFGKFSELKFKIIKLSFIFLFLKQNNLQLLFIC